VFLASFFQGEGGASRTNSQAQGRQRGGSGFHRGFNMFLNVNFEVLFIR
jgi:hypothetical protein